MCDTIERKNSDYSASADSPFRNFTMVETMGAATTEQGFFTRMIDKVMRVGGFIVNGSLKVIDEKVTDTLIDLAAYCILFVCYLESKQVDNSRNTD